ncbi:hypothetical protein M3G03_01630 [Aestuariimicrobium sp. p3-SID1156]|uniref:hypothetical protein n=1 Tax=Aestuariimicrobium sp. p3-SID1156 TaxID=2916038 RepID=UPI00223B8E5F|nr:hypothetical protein [Aestuariimicrobium sp. p3-SID1156]MCT1458254.1 hypothetical protein [Aestuariimicrobium sp. p3-SID1156]
MVSILRQAKHQAFVLSKRIRWLSSDVRLRIDDKRWARAQVRKPFVYNPVYYPHTFLLRQSMPLEDVRPVPNKLWVIWLGDGMSPAWKRSLETLQKQPGLDVQLITSFSDGLIAGHPPHPACADLNVMHQSDYLRAYLMHHVGGVYVDVKPVQSRLAEVVDRLNQNSNAWVAGYREVTSNYTPDLPHNLGDHIRRNYRAVMGPSAFACRPGSPFTGEWMRELNARLDYYAGALREAGCGSGNAYDRPPNYPIRWSEILGDIIQPLSMKYQSHMLFTDDIKPQLHNYR